MRFVTSLVHGFACVALMSGRRRHETHHDTNADTIVQDRRFVILEDFGCQAAVHDSLLALIIVWLPPLCISVIGIFLCRKSIVCADHDYSS
jgi:hypothetical protein